MVELMFEEELDKKDEAEEKSKIWGRQSQKGGWRGCWDPRLPLCQSLRDNHYWDGIGMELFILLHLFINSAKVDLDESVYFISFRDHCRKFWLSPAPGKKRFLRDLV